MATTHKGDSTAGYITHLVKPWPPEVQAAHDAVEEADKRIGEIIKALEAEHDITVKEIDVHAPEPFYGRWVTICWAMNEGEHDDGQPGTRAVEVTP